MWWWEPPAEGKVAQVEGLADKVVRSAGQGNPVGCGVREPASQRLAIGQKQREMEQARMALGGARARFFVEDEEVVAAGAERRHRVVMLVNPQPDRVPVVRERALEIGHGEVDRADG